MFRSIAYIPGVISPQPRPLSRFLPPIPDGVVTAWLKDNVPAGAWVLDPFGAVPNLAVEAARAGYRVLVAANNPVARFLLEFSASPPSGDELQVALAELGAARKGETRLEPHILSLYATVCANCGRQVDADAFIWARNEPAPFARLYRCPHCGDEGERPPTERDIENVRRFSAHGLHTAWALERIAPIDDPDRVRAEEALSVYPPRAIYALFTLINKLDGMALSPDRRRLLTALLISAADRSNSLWPHPSGRDRPLQLSTPPRFFEHNIWRAIEAATQEWSKAGEPVPLTLWPQIPSGPSGISMFQGRLRDLVNSLEDIDLAAVVAALPRPNQAFWTLSAIWSAWLWGREALGPFRSVLRRRRYDWSWHTAALQAAFQHLQPILKQDTPMLCLTAPAEPGFISAALIAPRFSGFEFTGMALRDESAQAQIHWRFNPSDPLSSETPEQTAIHAAQDFLKERGEPAPYLPVHAGTLASLAREGQFEALGDIPAEVLPKSNDLLQRILTYQHGFLRFAGSQHSLEVGSWWLTDSEASLHPLSDRVESALVDHLQERPGVTLNDIDAVLCTTFSGLQTPAGSLIQVCLDSYGHLNPESGGWTIRDQDAPQTRKMDREEMRQLLSQVGERLGYQSQGQSPLLWVEGEQLKYAFFVITSAMVGKILLTTTISPDQAMIVLPGGRANLVLYKLRCDPRLQRAVDEGWRFLKFRRLRQISKNPMLNRENMDEQFAVDPLTYTEPQIPLL